MEVDAMFWLFMLLCITTGMFYVRSDRKIWMPIMAVFLGISSIWVMPPLPLLLITWVLFTVLAFILLAPSFRKNMLTHHAFGLMKSMLPPISATEREAIAAGDTWWDVDLFSGNPDWQRMLSQCAPSLSKEEEAFLDGPVEELCRMLDDWHITHQAYDLPPEAWSLLKNKGFFGMVIPKKYGGLEFSAQAHSAMVMKVASRSITAAVTAMVPNSLGPGELLVRYGTEAQKDHYLPRLAIGEDIPCFALTSPFAGSDAASMQDTGIVCKGTFDGQDDVLGIRLNWEKRYITLAPVATILGLAFKLFDPDHLLGDTKERGITLALIPVDTAGVEIGRRHFPLNQAFQNGPVVGQDVFIPVDWIIGGAERVGQGWRMLMECLADGRAISLPSLSAGASKLCARATGAYAQVRHQFKLPIARFEGIEEVLGRMAAHTYAIDAVRQMTVIAVDEGNKPSVISAIAKYHCTERMRKTVNDAMDVFGGTAICMGPHNLMARVYESIPISITVEGANILTRNLIIYGQGILRCHPFLLQEMEALHDTDETHGLAAFDAALVSHIGFTASNAVRSLVLGLSHGKLARTPFHGAVAHDARHVMRFSANLAWVSDITLMVLGGALKRKEYVSARLGDVLSQLYIVSAAIKRFENEGHHEEDIPLLAWVCEDALYHAQQQMDAFLRNFPNRIIATLMRVIVFPLGLRFTPPNDCLTHEAAFLLSKPSAARDRLTQGIFISDDPDDPLGRIEYALKKTLEAKSAEEKLQRAIKAGNIRVQQKQAAIEAVLASGMINQEEADLLHESARAVSNAVMVDAFTDHAFKKVSSNINSHNDAT